MPTTSTSVAPAVNVCKNADAGMVATIETYQALWAYGQAMGWMDRPFHFVASSWLASRMPPDHTT